MSHHRPSLTQGIKQRPNLGTPYQIYTEMVDTGKNLQGTKRRIKWRVGWSDSTVEHEIEMVHSLVSGKKKITENGVEITSTVTFGSDFSFGWNADACTHVFRIEAQLGVEYLYHFMIDGVRFIDLPNKPPGLDSIRNSTGNSKSSSSNNGGFGAQPPRNSVGFSRASETDVNRNSVSNSRASGSFSTPDASPASNRNSLGGGSGNRTSISLRPPPGEKSSSSSNGGGGGGFGDSFDPFAPAASTQAAFDPFSSSSNSSTNNGSAASSSASFDPFGPSTATSAPAPAPGGGLKSLFSSFDEPPAPAPVATSNNSAAPFDPFGPTLSTSKPAAKAVTDGFDAFAPTATSKGATDPFAPTASVSVPAQVSTAAAVPSTSFALPPRPPPQSFDAFGSSTADSSDPFGLGTSATTAATTTTTTNPSIGNVARASRRQSAAEIAMDFQGLALVPNTGLGVAMNSARAPTPEPAPAPAIAPAPASAANNLADPWAAAGNLVNLNQIAVAPHPVETANNRRSSIRSSIALPSSSVGSAGSLDNINPFAKSNAITGMPTRIGGAPPTNPFQPAQADAFQGLTSLNGRGVGASSSLASGGGSSNVRGSIGGSLQAAAIQVNTRASISLGSNPPVGMQPRMSIAMAVPPPNLLNISNNHNAQQASQKSSLDSFDWRT